MGRKKVKIDYDTVKNLAKICCTQEEIASVMGCSVKTLQRRKQFNKAYQDGLNEARASLRRLQWKKALEGSVPMQIFLGKNLLGQRDKIEQQQEIAVHDDGFLEALKGTIKDDWDETG